MSQEIREKALDAAIKLAIGGNTDAEAVIAAAEQLAFFITGAPPAAKTASPKASVPTKTETKTEVEKAKPVTKPAAEKAKPVATKPAKPVATKPAKKAEADPDLKKAVGDKVNELLKANLREQAVDLLASFDGATSATSISLQGPEAVESFIAQADELLSATTEEGNLAD